MRYDLSVEERYNISKINDTYQKSFICILLKYRYISLNNLLLITDLFTRTMMTFLWRHYWLHDDDKDDDELFLWYGWPRNSDTLRAGFEPAQKLSSGLVEWSCAVVITTTLHHVPTQHNRFHMNEIRRKTFLPYKINCEAGEITDHVGTSLLLENKT